MSAQDTKKESGWQKKEFIANLEREVKQANSLLAEFQAKMSDDAAEALESADTAFKAAATVRVNTRVLKGLLSEDSKATLDTLREYALKKVLEGASVPRRSTSASSNLLSVEETVAWSGVYKHLVIYQGS